jgi:glutamate transport system substrate-binding protein
MLGDTEFRNFNNDVLEESYEDGSWADAWDRTAGKITGQEAPEPPKVDRY